jgi:apolipoprotein N-acyltransferase
MNKKNFAVTALVLGILAVLATIIGMGWLGAILAVAGGVLGYLGLKSEKKTLALIGLILSGLVIVWVLILVPIIGNIFEDVASGLGG